MKIGDCRALGKGEIDGARVINEFFIEAVVWSLGLAPKNLCIEQNEKILNLHPGSLSFPNTGVHGRWMGAL